MFQFRRFPSYAYFVQRRMTGYCPAGLPHSEISGSMDICSSPKLIAACHVLLRLLMPRHSPCALSSLTCSSQSPLGSVSAFAKTSPAPLLLAFRRKLVFGEEGRVRILLRVVREFLVLFENYAGFTKIEIVCHPASFRMLFHNQFASSCFHMTPLCCLTCFCHIVQFSRCRASKETSLRSLRLSAKLTPFRSFSFSHFKRFTGLKWEPSNRFCSQI